MDMKKMSKPRMDNYEYERKQRREREKSERQQVQTSSSNREVALFPEPRRVNPSEDDDKISAKLGDYSKARDFINLYTVGISNSGHRQMPANAVLPGIVPTSSPLPNVSGGVATSSSSAGFPSSTSSQRLLPPPPPQNQQQSQQPPHHYQQQQQLRQAPYVKQADNKPPYNGRGGYPGQPVNRLSSGMAPPKGPPSGSLLPPATTHMPNGRQSSSSSSSVEKSYLGPPPASSSSSATHNGRFSQPSIPKQRQKPLPPENDIKEIINHVTNTFCPPKMLTGIDATPHNTLMENYNLNEKNKHKYSFDILAKTSIVEPLDSPPRVQMPAPRFVPPLSTTSVTATQMPSKSLSNISSIPTSSSSTFIAPAINATASVTSSTSSSSGQSSSLITNAAVTSPTVPHSPILSRPSKDTLIKTLKTEKPTPPTVEKQNSTLENDLELSDSDDDRKKQNRSSVNTSDSSPSESSESESDSSRSEPQQPASIPPTHHLINHQQQMSSVLTTKKKIGPGSSGSIMGSGSSCSSGLGSSAPPSGGSSSSSSNKTPSPSNTTKWQLSRYFNKAPLHQTPTQDVVSPSTTSMVNSVNSMNVANLNMPITLRGGAQIIPEPPQHVANIKNESMIEDEDDDEDENNEMEDENIRRRNRGANKSETFPHPAFPSRKPPAGLSVTPLSPMLSDIKKEMSTPHVGMSVNQQQVPILNASEIVSIPSTQIKHEAMSIAGGHTTVTPYGCDVIEGLSNLSSDSNTSEDERLPVRGPGGTLQIPGVPAAITALPRSPPMVQNTQMSNSVTIVRFNSSPTATLTRPPPPPSRTKKPRKKLKQQSNSTIATDTSDEEQDDLSKRLVSPIASNTVCGTVSGVVTGQKKGRGRPRKTTPNQSGNISSASSVSASVKGPTLTAKKDINKKPASTTNSTATATARRRASRLNSSNSSAHDITSTTPTKQQTLVQTPVELVQAPQIITPPPLKEQLLTTNATSDDSSSSSESSTCSISKTSSSASDTDADADETVNKQTIISNTSSSDDEDTKNDKTASKMSLVVEQKPLPPKRIVKKLNTRKSSLEDLSAPLTSSNKPHNMSMSSSSSTSSSESSAEDFGHLPNTSTLTGGSSQQPSTSITSGSTSQRSTNHQSPHKVASAFSSESSGEERSDSDSVDPRKEKKLKRDKPKSDKNKISTLTRIFKSSNEGGAKKQGQVLIVDQSEDQQQQQQMHQQQKHISPALRLSQENLSAIHNSVQNTPTAQSPRLTPSGHMRSPRSINMAPLATQALAAAAFASHRTPDRNTTSAERKLQQRIKTPTRTPTRTPPTTRTPTPTPASVHHSNPSCSSSTLTSSAAPAPAASSSHHQSHIALLQPPPPTSLICKIDLSRLLNVPMEWHANTYRLYAPGHQQIHLTPSAGRTPIYDHETILNADLQSCNNQMRLKSTSSGGGSGSVTPRSTGNRTPIQIASTISSASERELSHSRENLHELTKENGNLGRLSSRSTDGSMCGGGSTPKDHLLPPNGYSSATAMIRGYNSPNATIGGVKLLTGVKHEQIIKHEPDSEYSCNETKFKSDSSSDPALIKQEVLILKQDCKLSDLSEKSSLCSPIDLPLEPKPRRKRSSSSSSSPYKEKKRKKEKDLGTTNLSEQDKIISVGSGDIVKENEITSDSLKSIKESAAIVECLTSANGQQAQIQKDQPLDQQYSPTNHDRLLMENKLTQQSSEKSNSFNNNNNNSNKLTNNVSNTASPAHLQNTNVNHSTTVVSTNMPPPANVGLIPTLVTQVSPSSVSSTKNAHNSAGSSSLTSHATISTASCSSVASKSGDAATTSSTTQPKVIYRSYFERDDDALSDEFSKDAKFLQEAIHRKHAADREQNTFNQVTLYLEAVVYFLLSGAAMEQHSRSEDAAWTMYKDTLSLIKFISSKFRHLQVSSANQHETHNKVAILSLRCQSLISLKLFKLKRNYCRQINNTCTEFFKSGKGDIINGNTPSSISPSNSVGSQGSGSNTPPGKIVPQDIHSALFQQNQYFGYLSSSHELWDQADRLVRQGNHTDFFIALDHENGPLTLHSNVYEVFRYVQAGLKKLKDDNK
ncbi:AF4/FMR2 family member lilliputian isoform 2-T2 [Cochliomyia hominivorax]